VIACAMSLRSSLDSPLVIIAERISFTEFIGYLL